MISCIFAHIDRPRNGPADFCAKLTEEEKDALIQLLDKLLAE